MEVGYGPPAADAHTKDIREVGVLCKDHGEPCGVMPVPGVGKILQDFAYRDFIVRGVSLDDFSTHAPLPGVRRDVRCNRYAIPPSAALRRMGLRSGTRKSHAGPARS